MRKSCCNTSDNPGHSEEASLPWFIIFVPSPLLFITWDDISPHSGPDITYSLVHIC